MMTDTPTQIPPQESQSAGSLGSDLTGAKVIAGKLKVIFTNLLNKFYSKKVVFWPVTIAFGLVFLIIVLGLLFGGKKRSTNIKTITTPTPFIFSSPLASPSGSLVETNNKLLNLKTQIDATDVEQQRLSLPTLNFDVRF